MPVLVGLPRMGHAAAARLLNAQIGAILRQNSASLPSGGLGGGLPTVFCA
jgi:hypothetical protein